MPADIAGMQDQIGRLLRLARLILSMVALDVAVVSMLAGLLKPMWLSLICTKLEVPPSAGAGVAANGVIPSVATSVVPRHLRIHYRQARSPPRAPSPSASAPAGP